MRDSIRNEIILLGDSNSEGFKIIIANKLRNTNIIRNHGIFTDNFNLSIVII